MRCGLLGRQLGHSYSPQIHQMLAQYDYQLYEKEPEALASFLQSECFTGINVTIPYKKAVIPFCNELSDRAKALGSVNTIVKHSDGTLIGHNTDYFGFESLVKKSGLAVAGKKVLVLGSGGASVTAVAVLNALGAKTIVISRTGENNYDNLHLHHDAAIIVNATPVGMYPNTNASPVDLDGFSKLEGVLDLIYNPAHTKLLQQAEKRGIVAENGLWMLVAQAKESAEWFSGKRIDDSQISKIYRKLAVGMKNIVLIGMPGSGKSSVGKALAQKLGKPIVDCDKRVEKTCQRSIPEIFAADGEDAFREVETSVLAELCKQSGFIISTGGGCVTRSENYALLHQNSIIIWLQRDLKKLPTDGRPLSQPEKLQEMYEHRKPLYKAFADFSVDNNGSINDTVDLILSLVEKEI